MNYQDTKCFEIFKSCVDAIHDGELIQQVSRRDKEFHFQNWCQKRLETKAYRCAGQSERHVTMY